jgi:hypothetical protein
MDRELEDVVRILATNRWPWRLHATYDQTISRALDVFERVARDIPVHGLNWFFDHAETISERSMDRIAALGGGIAVQHRMAYQGEYCVERYGLAAAAATPPFARMLSKGIRVSAGTDATRVASYNPWVSLAWLVTGKTVGGLRLYPERNCLDRDRAQDVDRERHLVLNEEGKKVASRQGRNRSYRPRPRLSLLPRGPRSRTSRRTSPSSAARSLRAGEFAQLDEAAPPPAMPDWSPVRRFGGYGAWADREHPATRAARSQNTTACAHSRTADTGAFTPFWGARGCSCWAL